MTAKEFIEDWYGTPIPPDWDLEYEALGNVTIVQLEDMLNQFALYIAEQAVREEKKIWVYEAKLDIIFSNILSRIKTLTNED